MLHLFDCIYDTTYGVLEFYRAKQINNREICIELLNVERLMSIVFVRMQLISFCT